MRSIVIRAANAPSGSHKRDLLLHLANTVLVRSLHLLPPEAAHKLAIWALSHRLVPDCTVPILPQLVTSFCGFSLRHPLGLAAGYDKNAKAAFGLFDLGFSFAEVGTVTSRPQAGNPGPRVFRLRRQQALINRMGFDNDGLEEVCARLAKLRFRPSPLGANIGANRDSADPVADYIACLHGLYP